MALRDIFRKKNDVPSCSVVIVAAGSSQRMGSDKIFGSLGTMPVLVRTALAFQKSPMVDEIIIVAKLEKIEEAAELCHRYKLDKVAKVVCGGKTRMESSLAGVSEVRKGARLIAIHDGARPLVSQELITRTIYAANDNMSAVPAVKSADTLKAVNERGCIVGTVDRETTVRVQTPQVFSADLIKGALTKAVTLGLSLTDDCSAIEMMGVKTQVVPGENDNIKLTTPRDLLFAEAILKDRGDYLESWPRL